ncbi:MAG: hypothetical protein V4691_00880 [Pseudomonadota bacterium]
MSVAQPASVQYGSDTSAQNGQDFSATLKTNYHAAAENIAGMVDGQQDFLQQLWADESWKETAF